MSLLSYFFLQPLPNNKRTSGHYKMYSPSVVYLSSSVIRQTSSLLLKWGGVLRLQEQLLNFFHINSPLENLILHFSYCHLSSCIQKLFILLVSLLLLPPGNPTQIHRDKKKSRKRIRYLGWLARLAEKSSYQTTKHLCCPFTTFCAFFLKRGAPWFNHGGLCAKVAMYHFFPIDRTQQFIRLLRLSYIWQIPVPTGQILLSTLGAFWLLWGQTGPSRMSLVTAVTSSEKHHRQTNRKPI